MTVVCTDLLRASRTIFAGGDSLVRSGSLGLVRSETCARAINVRARDLRYTYSVLSKVLLQLKVTLQPKVLLQLKVLLELKVSLQANLTLDRQVAEGYASAWARPCGIFLYS